MPLGKLPYRHEFLSSGAKIVDGAGTGWILTFRVEDGDGLLRDTKFVNIPMSGNAFDTFQQIQDQVHQVVMADAGSLGAFLDVVISSHPSKQWVTGDPAYVPDSIPLNGVASATWTNQPGALTALAGSTIQRDMTLASQARLVGNVITAGANAAVMGFQYLASGNNWRFLDGMSGPSFSLSGTGLRTSLWVPLEAEAKADVQTRLMGVSGNGTADPAFGEVELQVR